MLKHIFINESYYVMSLIVFLWIWQLIKLYDFYGFNFINFFKINYKGVVTALLLTITLFTVTEISFKTLSDETNLMAISKSMTHDKRVCNTTMGKYYYNNFNGIDERTPKRPLLFPYVTHIFHTLLGFNYKNVFVLNFITLFSLFLMIFIFFKNRVGELSSITGMILVASFPVISLYATSGGFDLFSAFFFFLSFIGLYNFMKRPSSTLLSFMLITFLMFINIRYESFVFFVFVFLALVSLKYLSKKLIKGSLVEIILFPLCMTPMIIQRILTSGNYENPKDVALFSVSSFFKHGFDFIKSIFRFDFFLPYSNILTILAIMLTPFLIYKLIVRCRIDKTLKVELHAALLLLCSILGGMIIYLSHHFGWYSHPTQARFFIVFSIGTALLPVFMLVYDNDFFSKKMLFIFSILMFVIYIPVSNEGRFLNALVINREFKENVRFIEDLKSRNVLLVMNRPGQFAALGYGSVNFYYANNNIEALKRELERKLYSEIYIFQRIKYGDGLPVKDHKLSEQYKLELLKKFQLTSRNYVIISRVIN